jgi:ribosomal protein S18 acetylase RimI-like enzyme
MTGLTYFKRFRMEIDLRPPLPPVPDVPEDYLLIPWDDGLLARHADTKWRCFRDEIDSEVFPSLAEQAGCLKLMEAIRYRPGFCAGATWLLACGLEYVGTIQGVRDAHGHGAIQNVGIDPRHRGRGLGSLLVLRALHGFREVGVVKAVLEVTARNGGALELYRRLGFRARRTVYKTAEQNPALVAERLAVR